MRWVGPQQEVNRGRKRICEYKATFVHHGGAPHGEVRGREEPRIKPIAGQHHWRNCIKPKQTCLIKGASVTSISLCDGRPQSKTLSIHTVMCPCFPVQFLCGFSTSFLLSPFPPAHVGFNVLQYIEGQTPFPSQQRGERRSNQGKHEELADLIFGSDYPGSWREVIIYFSVSVIRYCD